MPNEKKKRWRIENMKSRVYKKRVRIVKASRYSRRGTHVTCVWMWRAAWGKCSGSVAALFLSAVLRVSSGAVILPPEHTRSRQCCKGRCCHSHFSLSDWLTCSVSLNWAVNWPCTHINIFAHWCVSLIYVDKENVAHSYTSHKWTYYSPSYWRVWQADCAFLLKSLFIY